MLYHGVIIPTTVSESRCNYILDNHTSALENAHLVDEKIQKELSLGRIFCPLEQKPPDLVISPLAVVPKREVE